MPTPDPKPQQQKQQAPPEYTTKAAFEQKFRTTANNINWKNAQDIEDWLNNLKSGFHDYLSEHPEALRAAAYSQGFAQHLWDYLSLYRGQIVSHILSEASWELIFSALGPIGNTMRYAYHKDISWKQAWLQNPLNPNAYYYYFQSLPTRKAFEVLQYPMKAGYAILAHGGAPLIKKIYYQQDISGKTGWHKQTKSQYVFTPTWTASLVGHKLADNLDKLSGFPTDTFRPSDRQPSPWEKYVDTKNTNIKSAQKKIQLAKNKFKWGLDDAARKKAQLELKKANKNLQSILNHYDGSYLQAIFRKGLSNTARRLRQTQRDPLSYLLALAGGTIWDLAATILIRPITAALNKAINYIPGLSNLKAATAEFFTSNRWLSSARIAGITTSSFVKGTVSPFTVSSAYLGTQYAATLADFIGQITGNLGLASAIKLPLQITLGATWGGVGAFYNISLQMATNPRYKATLVNWLTGYQKHYSILNNPKATLAQKNLARAWIKDNFIRGLKSGPFTSKPGPFTKFAGFLNKNWLLRLPLNGFAARHFIQNYLPDPILNIDILGIPLGTIVNWLPAIDYLWQIKGNLAHFLAKKWTLRTWRIFGKSFASPHWRLFSLQNPHSWFGKIYSKYIYPSWLKIAKVPLVDSAPIGQGVFSIDKPWLRETKLFSRNFFNPGFFLGFSLVPWLSSLGLPGITPYLLAPVVGSLSWNAAARIAQSIWGSKGITMAKISASGWAGYFISTLTGLAIFGFNIPLWYQLMWTLGLPIINIGLASFGLSWSGILAKIIAPVASLFTSAPVAVATVTATISGWATAFSILGTAGISLTAVIVLYSGFYQPLMAEFRAQPQSSHFLINSACQQTSPNHYQCCASFNVTQDLLNLDNFLILKMNFKNTSLYIALNDPGSTTQAQRTLANQPSTDLDYTDNSSLNNNQYSILLPTPLTPNDPPCIGLSCTTDELTGKLSTPFDKKDTLYGHLADHPQLIKSLTLYLEKLSSLAKEHNQNSVLIPQLETELDFIKAQKKVVDNLVDVIKNSLTKNPTYIYNHLYQANQSLADSKSDNPIKDLDNPLYSSWEQLISDYQTSLQSPQTQAQKLISQDPSSSNYSQGLLILTNDLQSQLTDFETTSSSLQTQINTLSGKDGLIQQLKDIKQSLTFSEIQFLLEKDIFNYESLSPNDQFVLQDILNKYFESFINPSQVAYYVPKNTNYQLCAQAEYKGPPGEPQTICSTIYAQQSSTVYGSAFAKHCQTFTPQ